MSRLCKITGKKPLTGNNVSHSNRRTKTRQYPNLKKKRIYDEATGRWVTMKLSTSALRTITKNGLSKTLAKAKVKARA